jgi:transcriptional regulator with XRE-family HTH domain
MEVNAFGRFLKKLRESRDPPMSQEILGELVGRTKMTISLVENGKNDPPKEELLEMFIRALKLTYEEEIMFRDLAAIARGIVPSDIAEYFFSNQSLRNAIRIAKEKNMSDADWERLIRRV